MKVQGKINTIQKEQKSVQKKLVRSRYVRYLCIGEKQEKENIVVGI
jgi:hypothetical protein